MTQADMVKEAMVRIFHDYIYPNNIDCALLLQVHDELVFKFREDVNPEFPETVKKILLETTNKYLSNGLEMQADYHVAGTWIK